MTKHERFQHQKRSLYLLAKWPRVWNSSYRCIFRVHNVSQWPNLKLFISLGEMASCDVYYTRVHCTFRDSVHGTVSLLSNRFLSVTGNRRLGFGRRLFL